MKKLVMVGALVALLAAVALGAQGGNGAKHSTKAKLYGQAGTNVTATYVKMKKDGQKFRSFRVKVKHGESSQNYGVYVNGELVGTFSTNPAGNGKFELRSEAFINGNSNCEPIPADFPPLDTGDVVSVGPTCGVMYCCEDPQPQKYKCSGSGYSEYGAQATVSYLEKSVDGELNRCFKVVISGAAPDEAFDIYVDGYFAGAVFADAEGNAEFKLDNSSIPDDFPSLVSGTVVQVGSISVTLTCMTEEDEDDDSSDDDSSDDASSDDDDASSDDASSDDDSSSDDADDVSDDDDSDSSDDDDSSGDDDSEDDNDSYGDGHSGSG